MATSQSLNSIMEEMVAKVMEDAVSTSIIFTQAPTHENGKEKVFVKSYNLKNISDILFVHSRSQMHHRVRRQSLRQTTHLVTHPGVCPGILP